MALIEPTPGHKLKSESGPLYEFANNEWAVSEERALQVPEQIDQLRKEITAAGEYVDNLIERLNPVLQVELDAKTSKRGDTVNLVPLANEVRELYFLLADRVVSKLDYILRSLEI